MIKTNYYSFSSKINGNIHLNKNDIFKIVKIRDNICALDFENNLLFQIEPQTSDDKVLDYFNNIGENYASFSKLNKQKNEAIIDIHPI